MTSVRAFLKRSRVLRVPARRAYAMMMQSLEARRMFAVTVANPISDVVISAGAHTQNVDLGGVFATDNIKGTIVRMVTEVGGVQRNLDVELYDQAIEGRSAAPITTANFLNYVNSGRFSDTVFHRALNFSVPTQPAQFLQGGIFKADPASNSLSVVVTDPPISMEFADDRPNVQGTIAMGRSDTLNSATGSFFFNTIDNSNIFNAGNKYAVFGHVIGDGQSVLDAYSQLARINGSFNLAGVASPVPLQGVPVANASNGTALSNLLILRSADVVPNASSSFVYTVESSDAGVAAASVQNGQLQLSFGHNAGVANITVTAADLTGEIKTTTFSVTRVSVVPVGTLSLPDSVVEGSALAMGFSDLADPISGDRSSLRFSYDVGNDGTFDSFADPSHPGSTTTFLTTPTISIPANVLPGGPTTLTVRARVTNIDGAFTDYLGTVQILNAAPTADFSAPALGTLEEPIAVSATASDPFAGDVLSYQWDAKRNGVSILTGSQQDFGFTPHRPGLYTISLTVSDQDGGVAPVVVRTVAVPLAGSDTIDAVSPVGTVVPVIAPTTGSTRLQFSVVYTDDQGIDLETIINSAMTVRFPDSTEVPMEAVTTQGTGRVVVATYSLTHAFVAGEYGVGLGTPEVRDTFGNPVAAFSAGFTVAASATQLAPGSKDATFGDGRGAVASVSADVVYSLSDTFVSADGQVFSVGLATDPGHAGQVVVTAQHADGTRDGTFGNGGTVAFAAPFGLLASAVNFDGDGSILIVGKTSADGSYAVERTSRVGVLDTTFADESLLSLTAAFGGGDVVTAVRTQVDGKVKKLLAVGSSGGKLVMARVIADKAGAASLDRTFGTQGKVAVAGTSGEDRFTSLAVGKSIYVGAVVGGAARVYTLTLKGKSAVFTGVPLGGTGYAAVDRVMVDPVGRVVFSVSTADSIDSANTELTGQVVGRLAVVKGKLVLDGTFSSGEQPGVVRSSSTGMGRVGLALDSSATGGLTVQGGQAVAGSTVLTTTRLQADGANLAVTAAALGTSKPVKVGGKVAIKYTLTSTSSLASSGAYGLKVIFAPASDPGPGDEFMSATFDLTLKKLLPGSKVALTRNLTLPAGLVAGEYVVYVKLVNAAGGARNDDGSDDTLAATAHLTVK